MTNEELKKKICDIIAPYVSAYGDDERIADALIAAGIGDVKDVEAEANRYEMLYKLQNRDMALAERRAHDVEHRAERAERALLTACIKMVKDEKSDVNIELLVGVIYRKYLKQAEKELAEERKDE